MDECLSVLLLSISVNYEVYKKYKLHVFWAHVPYVVNV